MHYRNVVKVKKSRLDVARGRRPTEKELTERDEWRRRVCKKEGRPRNGPSFHPLPLYSRVTPKMFRPIETIETRIPTTGLHPKPILLLILSGKEVPTKKPEKLHRTTRGRGHRRKRTHLKRESPPVNVEGIVGHPRPTWET